MTDNEKNKKIAEWLELLNLKGCNTEFNLLSTSEQKIVTNFISRTTKS